METIDLVPPPVAMMAILGTCGHRSRLLERALPQTRTWSNPSLAKMGEGGELVREKGGEGEGLRTALHRAVGHLVG